MPIKVLSRQPDSVRMDSSLKGSDRPSLIYEMATEGFDEFNTDAPVPRTITEDCSENINITLVNESNEKLKYGEDQTNSEEVNVHDNSIAAFNSKDNLLDAIKEDRPNAVAYLLQNGANADCPVDDQGNSPLHWAVYLKHSSYITMLVNAGARTGICNSLGVTPFMCACNTLSSVPDDELEHLIKLLLRDCNIMKLLLRDCIINVSNTMEKQYSTWLFRMVVQK